MGSHFLRIQRILAGIVVLTVLSSAWSETFRVATFNVENYLARATETRRVKPAAARAKVQESILAMKPDIIAFQEMGQKTALVELRDALKAKGLDFPYSEWMEGWDTNIHLAVLSRFPIVERRPHTKEPFLLSGRRFHVSRGFAEVDIRVSTNYTFTLLSCHLKSKRRIPEADEAEMRGEEAKILRRIVDERLAANPRANILVCGDLNDFYNSDPVRTIVGRGRNKLVDTRPAEKNGDDQPNPRNPEWFPRNVAWTHLYGVEDTYSRIDYILLSPGMAREWVEADTYVLTIANWGIGSDHRPLLATFSTEDN